MNSYPWFLSLHGHVGMPVTTTIQYGREVCPFEVQDLVKYDDGCQSYFL